jgi:hypothetical protein
MAEAALSDPDEGAWADTLSRIDHDVYHLPEYVRLDAQLSGGKPVAFRYMDAERFLLLPLVLRPIPESYLKDAISPYGYPGPASNADPDDLDFWRDAGRALIDTLAADRVISAFVRVHPLLGTPVDALAETGTVVRHGQTVSIDLRQHPDEMWHQTHRTHRNQINKARRAGVTVVFDDWDRLDEWVEAYHATMRRVDATDFYFFDAGHFHRLRAALGDRVHLAIAVDAGGVLLGGNLFFEYRGLMHTHLQGTRDLRVNHADKLLYDEIRRWGHARGNRVYHLGGGVGGSAEDSLFRYKAAFSAGREDFHTWRVVSDPEMFTKLSGGEPTPEMMASRFPPYR